MSMEQKMQEQMEGSEYAHQQAYENVCEKIENYIKDCNYTWTVKEVFEQYWKYKRNEYISFTANDIVDKFNNEIEKL